MLWVLMTGQFIIIFLFVMNGFLDGVKKQTISAWLFWLWLGCVIAAIINFGWMGAGAAIGLSVVAPALSRGLATRLAAALMAIGTQGGGGPHPGPPPQDLRRLSVRLDRCSRFDARDVLAEMVFKIRTGQRTPKEIAVDELLDLVMSRERSRVIVKAHGGDREFLMNAFHRLELGGAGKWAGAHYASASGIFYDKTLEYVLSSQRAGVSDLDVAYAVNRYFQSGTPLTEGPTA